MVIINEAHHSPRQRAFTHDLMLALRDVGFTHFAAETFCSGLHCGPLLVDGAPVGNAVTGFYTMEPVFGDLARQAEVAGYTLIGYEITPEQRAAFGADPNIDIRNYRELSQAENIKAVLDSDPELRILIHVGFGHVAESLPDAPLHVFAGRLKELTGEDPLTIDQTQGTEQHGDHNSLLYRAYVSHFGAPAIPVAIPYGSERPSGTYRVDYGVIHPEQQLINGRPDWLGMGGYRKPRVVPLQALGVRSLVRAFVVGEPEGAIAMDQMLVGPDAEAVTLMLPSGEYRLVRQTVMGENLPLGVIEIE